MVIISDGNPTPPSRAMIQQFQQAKISVTTICINPHGGSDTGMMKWVAQQTKGRYYLVQDPRKLPQIFMREALQVHRSLITEEDFYPAVAMASEVVAGLGDEGFPQLHGYVLTTAKPLAETSLVSHTQDPILSIWRYGLGRTAAFTSDGGGRWASDWVGWSGYEPFWAQLVRSIARRGGDEIFRYDRSIDGDRGRIILDAIDAEGHYLDELGISGRVMSPKFDEEKVTFQQTGPGRYEAEFQARQSGTYLVALDYERADGVRGAAQAGVTVSYSPEYRNLSSDVARLEALAAATGGRVLDWTDDFFDRNVPAQLHRLPQFELLLELLLFLFFADIVFRRVIFSMAPVARLVERFRSRPVPVGDEASTRLLGSLLEKRKQLRPQGERPVIQVREGAEPSGSVPGDAGRRDVERPSRERSEPRAASFTDRPLEAKRRAQRDLERRDQD